jgi:hypothetical protein
MTAKRALAALDSGPIGPSLLRNHYGCSKFEAWDFRRKSFVIGQLAT